MAILSDNPAPLSSPPAGPPPDALSDIVKSLGAAVSVALAHTSRSEELELHRRIEHAIGRQLEPRFAQELLTLVLAPGNDGRALRAAFVKLLSMTESQEWAAPLSGNPPALPHSDSASKFLASEEAACVQDLARCGECLASSAAKREGTPVSSDEAARLQWAACAQCRCGTAAWYRS